MDQRAEKDFRNVSDVTEFLPDYEYSSSVDDLLFQNDTNSTNSSDEFVYEYEIDTSFGAIPLEEFIPVLLGYGLTLVLGVAGNLLVIFAIAKYKRMQSVTNIFLISLSTADLLLVLICVPIKFAKFFTFTWNFGIFLCKAVHYVQNVSAICSVLTLTTMSIERYYAILHPMRAKYACTLPRTRRVIIALWLSSFTLAVPIIFGQIHKKIGFKTDDYYWCVKGWSTSLEEKLYEVGMLLLILVIPLSVMTFAYSSICKELWVMTSNRRKLRASNTYQRGDKSGLCGSGNQSSSNAAGVARRRPKALKDDDATRKQVIKMLVAIIILFGLCWAPCLIDNVLVAFDVLDRQHHGYLKPMRQLFALMSYFNSCVNPCVYAFMSRNFRDIFKHALCGCTEKTERHARNYRYNRSTSSQSTFQTRTTSMSSSFTRTPPNGMSYGMNYRSDNEERDFIEDDTRT